MIQKTPIPGAFWFLFMNIMGRGIERTTTGLEVQRVNYWTTEAALKYFRDYKPKSRATMLYIGT